MISSYPKVYALGNRNVRDIFKETVLVEEKVDGSQISFGVYEGTLKVRSHGQEVNLENPGMFGLAVQEIVKRVGQLQNNSTYRGEYLSKPKHNVLSYGRIPKGNIILFDITFPDLQGQESFSDRWFKEKEAERLDFDVVPVIYQGMIANSEMIKGLLERESILGGVNIEGVVIKNYARRDLDGKVLMAKYVSEKFKEVMTGRMRNPKQSLEGYIQELAASYATEARWQKAIQKLTESGEIQNDPKDIGSLVKLIQVDVLEEEKETLGDLVMEKILPIIMKGCVNGMPQWYKQKLMEDQFKETNEG